jgi:hypothetical protein
VAPPPPHPGHGSHTGFPPGYGHHHPASYPIPPSGPGSGSGGYRDAVEYYPNMMNHPAHTHSHNNNNHNAYTMMTSSSPYALPNNNNNNNNQNEHSELLDNNNNNNKDDVDNDNNNDNNSDNENDNVSSAEDDDDDRPHTNNNNNNNNNNNAFLSPLARAFNSTIDELVGTNASPTNNHHNNNNNHNSSMRSRKNVLSSSVTTGSTSGIPASVPVTESPGSSSRGMLLSRTNSTRDNTNTVATLSRTMSAHHNNNNNLTAMNEEKVVGPNHSSINNNNKPGSPGSSPPPPPPSAPATNIAATNRLPVSYSMGNVHINNNNNNHIQVNLTPLSSPIGAIITSSNSNNNPARRSPLSKTTSLNTPTNNYNTPTTTNMMSRAKSTTSHNTSVISPFGGSNLARIVTSGDQGVVTTATVNLARKASLKRIARDIELQQQRGNNNNNNNTVTMVSPNITVAKNSSTSGPK